MAVLWAVNASACAPVIRHGPATQAVVWPVYLGSPAHDASARDRMEGPPTLGWRMQAGREVRGAPAIGAGVLALGNTERMVLLVDADSGHVLWDRRVSGTVRGSPLLTNDRVYAATEESPQGRVYALALPTGKVLWNVKTGSVAASLALADGTVYAGTESGMVLALDAKDGNVRWRRALMGAILAAPVATAAGLVVTTTTDSIYLIDPGSGAVRRRMALPGAVLATPATDGTRLYLGTVTGILEAVDPATLDTVWSLNVGSGVYGAPALARDTLFALTRAGHLISVPLAAPAARHDVDLGIISVAGPTPLASGDGVVVTDVTGGVRCVDPGTGADRWRVTASGPVEQPALVRNGRLFVVADRGQVAMYK